MSTDIDSKLIFKIQGHLLHGVGYQRDCLIGLIRTLYVVTVDKPVEIAVVYLTGFNPEWEVGW
jgi:hypothetical protein